jgi:hypothetical protein
LGWARPYLHLSSRADNRTSPRSRSHTNCTNAHVHAYTHMYTHIQHALGLAFLGEARLAQLGSPMRASPLRKSGLAQARQAHSAQANPDSRSQGLPGLAHEGKSRLQDSGLAQASPDSRSARARLTASPAARVRFVLTA